MIKIKPNAWCYFYSRICFQFFFFMSIFLLYIVLAFTADLILTFNLSLQPRLLCRCSPPYYVKIWCIMSLQPRFILSLKMSLQPRLNPLMYFFWKKKNIIFMLNINNYKTCANGFFQELHATCDMRQKNFFFFFFAFFYFWKYCTRGHMRLEKSSRRIRD